MTFPTVCSFLLMLPGAGQAAQSTHSNAIVRVAADPVQGFHSPYFLSVPDSIRQASKQKQHSVLIIPNNTGSVSDDPAVHEQRARRTIEQTVKNMGNQLNLIVLVPIFPRPRSDWRIYTQALDRDAMLTAKEPLRRPDMQLVAMLDHARTQLKEQGISTDSRVFLFGFSASGMFVNRFTFLHPERVRAAAFGSPGGWPLAPVAEEGGKLLRYPIGLGDGQVVAGKPYDVKALAQVPLFVFLGDKDTNDSVIIRDSFELEDEKLIASLFGATPLARWSHTERLYRHTLPLATLKLYQGVAHTVTPAIMTDVLEFFKKHVPE